MTVAYVGLGANIGEPRLQLEAAIAELKKLPDTDFVLASGIYKSGPVGYLDQPDFLNAVARLDTRLAPEALLGRLQDIEQRHGRERLFAGAPRTLDLDLLLYGDQAIASARLTVPHPRMHERAFVLEPLTEIAPDIVIPGRGAARELLAACSTQNVERVS
ncbi:MAG TPA: 2-amino-4-hydroxy-6-hydroxymethyldihydropteridine diphosphokinase [Burkholderiales bacterium]|nr:2-amino-4-hydroxy-6-hydroxymethyldihydropteridine diphosphokinase [Burkholderiales bacterium]